jgi:hypothetical protein
MQNNTTEKNQFAVFLNEKRTALGMTYKQFSMHIYGRLNKDVHLCDLETEKRKASWTTLNFILNKLNCRLNIEEL